MNDDDDLSDDEVDEIERYVSAALDADVAIMQARETAEAFDHALHAMRGHLLLH